jgi:hypothetical protein
MEAAMNATHNRNDSGTATPPRVTKRLHRRVYALLIGLSAWLVLSVWLFAGGGVADYLLFIVSGFIFIAVALPFILSRVGRSGDTADAGTAEPSYHDWAAADFDTWQGRLHGNEAATQILLPIAAVAIGMTVFGVVFHIAEHKGPLVPTASYSSGSVVKNNG